MKGTELKQLLQGHGISGQKLAEIMNMHERTIYGWYRSAIIKKGTIEKIIAKTQLSRSLFFNDHKNVSSVENNNDSVHEGERIAELIKDKGMKKDAFAEKMQFSRQTLHDRIKQEKWTTKELLLAAAILNVPVSDITGKPGAVSFQKEIYMELSNINKLLEKIAHKLNVTN